MFYFYYCDVLQSKHRTLKNAVIKAYSFPSHKHCEITDKDGRNLLSDEFSTIESMGLEWFKANG